MSELDVWAEIRRLKSQLDRLTSFEWPPYSDSPGTWIPSFVGTGVAGTFTYVTQIGRYQILGNHCRIYGRVIISAIAVAPTVDMTIAGLPFPAVNVANIFGGIWFIVINNFNYAAAAMDFSGYIGPNASVINLVESFDNLAAVNSPAANFNNANCGLTFRGEYQISGT